MQLEGIHTNFTINSFKNQSNSKLSRRLALRISFQLKMSIASLHMHSQGKWSPVSDHKSRWARHGIDNVVLAEKASGDPGQPKIWKFHPVFLQEKTCQTRPDWIDPSDRLFWDLSLCCLNMVYHRYPNFQPQKLGLHQQAWDCVVRCPKKFGSIRGPGTPRGRRARPGGRKDQIDFLWNLFSKKYGSWRLKCLCLMLFAISITWTSKTSWLSTKIGDVLWKSLASKKPKPRCVAA